MYEPVREKNDSCYPFTYLTRQIPYSLWQIAMRLRKCLIVFIQLGINRAYYLFHYKKIKLIIVNKTLIFHRLMANQLLNVFKD